MNIFVDIIISFLQIPPNIDYNYYAIELIDCDYFFWYYNFIGVETL